MHDVTRIIAEFGLSPSSKQSNSPKREKHKISTSLCLAPLLHASNISGDLMGRCTHGIKDQSILLRKIADQQSVCADEATALAMSSSCVFSVL
jgi:hypothetical protein